MGRARLSAARINRRSVTDRLFSVATAFAEALGVLLVGMRAAAADHPLEPLSAQEYQSAYRIELAHFHDSANDLPMPALLTSTAMNCFPVQRLELSSTS